MTWPSRLMGLYPSALVAHLLALFAYGLFSHSSLALIGFVVCIYIVPPLCYRIHNSISPLSHGLTTLSERRYSSWWGGHQIQLVFAIFPVFERILRAVPGAYSFWLRLWGSKVGRGVYWTPSTAIEDRGSMVIGDNVVFGHKVECYCHVIKPKDGALRLFTKPITIGDNTFIGAGTRIGPGVHIENGTFVPILTDLFVNERADKRSGA